jgi:SAM-dependent methyltransferase
VAPPGPALDLACGSGRHTRYLAAQGYDVLAVDRDPAALAGLASLSGVATRCLDLEGDHWPLAGESFALIVVTRYLHRPRWPDLAALLCDGGILIHETFMVGHEAYGSPRRPEFLLRENELLTLAELAGLNVLDFRQGLAIGATPAVTQSICCLRRTAES